MLPLRKASLRDGKDNRGRGGLSQDVLPLLPLQPCAQVSFDDDRSDDMMTKKVKGKP